MKNEYTFTLRTLIMVSIMLVVAFMVSFWYVEGRIGAKLNQNTVVSNMNAITQTALVDLLVEKGVISNEEVRKKINELCDQMESFVKKRKKK